MVDARFPVHSSWRLLEDNPLDPTCAVDRLESVGLSELHTRC